MLRVEDMAHFTAAEFVCDCGECDGGADQMDGRFLQLLNDARKKAGVPFRVNSAYRCPAYNERIGGVENSAHTKGCAIDIDAPTSHQRWRIVQAAVAVGFTRIGVAQEFVHLDRDLSKPTKVMWLY